MEDPKVMVGPMQYADANPTETRLKTFQRLATLKLKRQLTFKKWADEEKLSPEERTRAFQVWSACWSTMQIDEMFHLLRTASVFDESFRLPQLNAGTEEFQVNVEKKFADLMQRISLMTLKIQKEQESIVEEVGPNGNADPSGECHVC